MNSMNNRISERKAINNKLGGIKNSYSPTLLSSALIRKAPDRKGYPTAEFMVKNKTGIFRRSIEERANTNKVSSRSLIITLNSNKKMRPESIWDDLKEVLLVQDGKIFVKEK